MDAGKVYFEYCVKCERHQWCTTHVAAKYESYFSLCNRHSGKEELTRTHPDLQVICNKIPPALFSHYNSQSGTERTFGPGRLVFPRLGAFEVYYKGKVIFSKLATGLWPHPQVIRKRIEEIDAIAPPAELPIAAKKPLRRLRKKTELKRFASARALKLTQETANRPRTTRPATVRSNTQRNGNTASHQSLPRLPVRGWKNSEKGRQVKTEESMGERGKREETVVVAATEPNEDWQEVEEVEDAEAHKQELTEQPGTAPRKKAVIWDLERLCQEERSNQSCDEPTPERLDFHKKLRMKSLDWALPQGHKQHARKASDRSLRPVTNTVFLDVPLGTHFSKKISHENSAEATAVFTLKSSNPELMGLRDTLLSIPAHQPCPIRLQFTPQQSPCTLRFFVYLDRDSQPCACVEIIARYA